MDVLAKALIQACKIIDGAVLVASINAISDLQIGQKVRKIADMLTYMELVTVP